tara:strand:- start:691 stop:1389 length:699 start_codon:yes stop_codon:yes gene_type:complete
MFTIRDYDSAKYKFAEMLKGLFGVEDLNQVHILDPALCEESAAVSFNNEVKTFFHEKFYEKLRSPWNDFINTYDKFIENEVAPIFDKKAFVYQKTPSFRVHVPNNKAVSLWHTDSDEKHLHPLGEINFIIPMTKAFGTNATWTETEPGKEDFQPMEMEYGQFVQFSGNTCHHGNKVNKTGVSRVSFDFRIMPMELYKPDEWDTPDRAAARHAAGTTKTKFVIGDYYSLYEGK